MLTKIKPQLNNLLEKIIGPISKSWNPNLITSFSIFLALIPTYLFAEGKFIAGALSLAVYVFDAIDGTVARVHGKTSKFGGYLDAVCDRFADGIVFLGIAASGFVRIELCILALIGSFLVSYSKSKGEVVIGIDKPGANELSIGLAERSERLIIIFIFGILQGLISDKYFNLSIMDFGFILLTLLTFMTTLMRMRKTYLNVK